MRLAVPLAIDPAAFATWRQGMPVIAMDGETMGTTWHVQFTAMPGLDRAAVRRAIEARLEDILAQMSHWRADSLLGRFNRAGPGKATTLPPDFRHVMIAACDIARRSGGAFDPAIGALVDLWGHGPAGPAPVPSPDQVEQARVASGFMRLRDDPVGGCLHQPGSLRLDLSGIAKGHAVDALTHSLGTMGYDHALVEIGGELSGRGLKPDGDPWWVDLETPAQHIAPLRIALHELAVATSGDYVRGRHTIDPRSGYPVEHAMAVSILDPSAMLADAWATALSVLHPEAMQALAMRERLPVRALTRNGATITEWISPSLEAMIESA